MGHLKVRQLVCLFGMAFVYSVGFAQQVEIRLRSPSISTTNAIVRLQDVADLVGGDPAIRYRLATLDLDEFSQQQTSIEITSESVRYRILIAGISDSKFHIAAATTTTVNQWLPANINAMMERSLTAQFAETYQIAEGEFELKLVSTLDSALLRADLDLNSINVSASLPAEMPINQRNIPMTVSDATGKSLNLNAVCRLTIYQEVAMVSTGIAKGEQLNEANVTRVRRPLANSQVSVASYEQAIGKVAQVDLQPFSIINQQAIRSTPTTRNKPDVTRNTLITILVRQGNLTVTLKNARANQSGRIGETIALTNPLSNKIIYAKLVDTGTAVIER